MKNHLKSGLCRIAFVPVTSLALLGSSVFSQGPKTVENVTGLPPVTVPLTEVRSFHSRILDRDMEICVKLPVTYNIQPDKKYPAWYFTDANRNFPMLSNIVSVFDIPAPGKPEIILVGIGYKIRDMADWADYRTKDLTLLNVPSVDATWNKMLSQITGREFSVKSGGAEKFLGFIEKELIPMIESNYRILPGERCLGGYSYGGLFSLYVMFMRPELFTKFYAGSPSIGFGDGFLFKMEVNFASGHKDLKARLCMTAGGSEDSAMIADVNRLTAILKSRRYAGFSVETYIFPDETHQSCIPASLMRGYVVLNR